MSISTKIITNYSEFKSVDAIYQNSFLADSIPTNIQHQWWKRFPSGIIGLFHDNTVIGGLSYWPLDEKAFDDFSNGKIKEKEISFLSIDTINPKGFYLSEIAISPPFRMKNYASLLFIHFCEQRNNFLKSKIKLPLLALAYSEGGKKILHNFGFQLLKTSTEMPDQQELYVLYE